MPDKVLVMSFRCVALLDTIVCIIVITSDTGIPAVYHFENSILMEETSDTVEA